MPIVQVEARLSTDELVKTDQIENLEARRMEYLAELARLRQTSLVKLMKNLGTRPPAYV